VEKWLTIKNLIVHKISQGEGCEILAIDKQAELILAKKASAGIPPFYELSPEKARAFYNNEKLSGPKEAVFQVEDLFIPTSSHNIPIRMYTPEGQGPFGAFLYFHGGGWVIGNLDSFDSLCRTLANRIGCIVISVDYRLAPEYKFPAAIEDAYAAVQWTYEHALQYRIHPNKIAVGGDSAGGNLAIAVTQMAKERGGLPIIFQVLMYPITCYRKEGGYASYTLYKEGYFLTVRCLEWFWNHYLSNEEDGDHPYVSPLLSKNLSQLPPGLIITAEYDPLRDEGEAYAKKLEEFGVPVTCTRYEGMIHGFFTFYGVVDKGNHAVNQVSEKLRSVFYGNVN
jgi:acetyl esterase